MAHHGLVSLNRALSKLGVLSRAQATEAIVDGRVRVDGRVARDPATRVMPERSRITVDNQVVGRRAWRTVAFHKPAGILTTRRDPEGRPTIYDVLKEAAAGLVPVGRLDRATSGLILLTSDTQLANWITDPANDTPRVYIATVRGRVTPDEADRLVSGVRSAGDILRASSVKLRKVSERESHVIIDLREGKNREVRRLFEAIGHPVTRLKRVRIGGIELGALAPGQWTALTRHEIRKAFPQKDE